MVVNLKTVHSQHGSEDMVSEDIKFQYEWSFVGNNVTSLEYEMGNMLWNTQLEDGKLLWNLQLLDDFVTNYYVL